MTAIWWIRRDLRLTNTPALHAAISTSLTASLEAGGVVPVFILDPRFDSASLRRCDLLYEGLHTLDKNLRQRNSYLVPLYGGEQSMRTGGGALTSWRRLARIQG